MEPAFQTDIPWYKTKMGKIFLMIIIICFVLFILFSTLVGYYIWRVATGQETTINSPFSTTLSQNNLNEPAQTINIAQIQQRIRTDNPTIGDTNAPVTIVAFIDFECPYCRAGFSSFETATAEYADAIQIVFKHVPLIAIHPQSAIAAAAAQCAHRQDKFWGYYRSLFGTTNLSEESLTRIAQTHALNLSMWNTCRQDKSIQTFLNQDLTDSVALGVRGTPTFFVNNTRVEGVKTVEQWRELILNAIQQ
jgi:protein-disulfide isomerase